MTSQREARLRADNEAMRIELAHLKSLMARRDGPSGGGGEMGKCIAGDHTRMLVCEAL